MEANDFATLVNRLNAGAHSSEDLQQLKVGLITGKIFYVPTGRPQPNEERHPFRSIGIAGYSQAIELSTEAAEALRTLRRPTSAPPGFSGLADRGAIPDGSRVPFLTNPKFWGREAELRNIWAKIHPESMDKAVYLTGPKNVGKTQIAIEFCHRYGRFYQSVHWINARNPIELELHRVGSALPLKSWPATRGGQIQEVLKYW